MLPSGTDLTERFIFSVIHGFYIFFDAQWLQLPYGGVSKTSDKFPPILSQIDHES